MIDLLLKKNVLPDWLIRTGIRRLLKQRLQDEARNAGPDHEHRLRVYADDLRHRPIAENTATANEQHYEVPTAFYQLCLGPQLKYSGCYYPAGTESLAEAEDAMLEMYLARAGLDEGQEILDLGCGWGSLSLYLARRFPTARVTAVSNSRTQREFIEAEARKRGLENLRVTTADMNDFDAPAGHFDRVVSVEMFEHMKNYRRLLAHVSRWLKPDGKLFVHIFTHRRFAYHFEPEGPSDWMARHFFSGGQMPAHDLLAQFQDNLSLVRDWKINGRHYQRTAEHWLQNMDKNREQIMELFAETYGNDAAGQWWAYWRTFFMSCAELWGYRDGEEWLVSHYLFEQRIRPDTRARRS